MTGYAAKYEPNGLIVVSVDVKEDPAIVAPFMSSLGVSYPVGLDPDGSAADRWRAAVMPVHYWVDATGVIRDGAAGGIGPDVMAAGLRTIMPGITITP